MKPVFLQVIDSRANPTLQGRIIVDGAPIQIAVPSGASTGVHEAHELRDEEQAYQGRGVNKAMHNAQQLANELDWRNADVQETDSWLLTQDETANKSAYGANALLAISMLQTAAQARQESAELFELIARLANTEPALPLPFANVINGGEHAQNQLQLQEFMIVPIHANTFAQATQQVAETYSCLKTIIAEKYGPGQTALGDEGGFAPAVSDAHEACSLLMQAMNASGHDMAIAMDPAASEFYSKKGYEAKKGTFLSAEELTEYYVQLVEEFPIISLEDPFDQDDFQAFAKLQAALRDTPCQVVGDDLTVTNTKRIQQAIDAQAANSLLLKINQIGLVTQAIDAATLALKNDWTVMVSHRSGETEDTFIADLAVGLGTGQIKLGAPARGERTAKYNRLLTIEATSNVQLASHPWQNL